MAQSDKPRQVGTSWPGPSKRATQRRSSGRSRVHEGGTTGCEDKWPMWVGRRQWRSSEDMTAEEERRTQPSSELGRVLREAREEGLKTRRLGVTRHGGSPTSSISGRARRRQGQTERSRCARSAACASWLASSGPTAGRGSRQCEDEGAEMSHDRERQSTLANHRRPGPASISQCDYEPV